MKRVNQKRDYDEEPIVISNNFTSMIFGIFFWLLFNGLIIYLVFFGDAIDWSQNKDWISIFKDEMEKSVRFGAILIGTIFANIMAIISFYKMLKKSQLIILKKKLILSSKNINNLENISLSDIKEIKKSFSPLLITGKGGLIVYTLARLFISLSIFIFWIVRIIIWIFYKVFLQDEPYLTKYPYITVFSKTTNRVINIHIISKKEYLQLRKYFLKTLNIDLDTIDINFNLSNI